MPMGYLIGNGYADVVGDADSVESLRDTIYEFFSENGIRTNNEDGTNAAAKQPRDYDTGIAWNDTRFAAYKAAMLAQNKKLVPSIAKEVVPATNLVTYESVGEENVSN